MQMIGSVFGYLLWWLFLIFKNYGIAIILFTVIVKLVSFPLSLKQQKSMASQSRLAGKQKEIQERYPNDKQKQSEELQKLYDKEGTSPMSGCLSSLLPFIVMFGIFYAVTSPLSNTLHIQKESITAATEYMSKIPGVSSVSPYREMEIIQNFGGLKTYFKANDIFSDEDVEKIELLSEDGLNFFGLNLLGTPKGSSFDSYLWILPVLSLIVNLLTSVYSQKANPNMQAGQNQQGCMKWVLYLLPLISVYYAYSMPGALGFYWIISGITNFLQTFVTNRYFSVNHMTAKQEASRAVTLELKEANIRPLSANAQRQIAEKLNSTPKHPEQEKGRKETGASNKQRHKKQGNNSSQYRGKKK